MKNKKIIIICLSLLIVSLFVILFIYFYTKRENIIEEKDYHVETFKGLSLKIPNQLEYKLNQEDANSFIIQSSEWKAVLTPIYDEYDHTFTYKICTHKTFKDASASIGEIETLDDVNNQNMYFNYSDIENEQEKKYIIYYHKINDTVNIYTYIENNDNSYSEVALKDISSILSGATYTGNGNSNNYKTPKIALYHQCHDIEKYDAE